MKNYTQSIQDFGKKMALRTAQAASLALLAGSIAYVGAQKMANPNPSYIQQTQTYQDSNNNSLYDTSRVDTFEYFKDGTIELRKTEQRDLGGEVSAETIREMLGPNNCEIGLTKIVYE
jgi:hypothetical protein